MKNVQTLAKNPIIEFIHLLQNMNKKLIALPSPFLFLLMAMISSSANAQLDLSLQKTYGVSTANEQATAIQALPNGGFVTTYNLQVGGSGPLGNQYVTVVAYDANGNISWEKNLGGPGGDFANDILVETNGDIVIAGQSNSNVGLGFPDLWVVKLDSQSNILWEVFYGGSKEDRGTSISRTSDGGYFIAGRTRSSDGDVEPVIPANLNNAGMWAVKLGQSGNLEWNEVYYGQGVFLIDFYGYQTSDGGFLIGGSAFGSGGDVPVGNGDYDYWVIKTDPQRNIEWTKTYGGSGPEFLQSVRPTSDGGTILSGHSNSSISGDISERFGAQDFWIVKLDQTGNITWERSLGGTDSDAFATAIEDQNGQVLVAGRINSSDGLVSNNYGESDIWVVALDGNGQLLQEKNFGGSSFEQPVDLALSPDGVYIAGYTRSNDFDVTDFSGTLKWDGWTIEVKNEGGGSPPANSEIDLALSMNAPSENPLIYSNAEVSLTITNTGDETATGVEVAFPKPADFVYTGGNEWTATQGSFIPFGNETWAVGNLAPNASATITVSYFILTSDARTAYAQVTAANGNDLDSSPGNGTCCLAIEDDEAALTLNFFGGNCQAPTITDISAVGNSSIQVTWTPEQQDDGYFLRWIEQSTGLVSGLIIGTNVNSFTITSNFQPGVVYDFFILTNCVQGSSFSEYSDTVSFTFPGGNPQLICPGDITLSSQAEVDAWPGCTIVEGNLTISGNDITDLSPLNTLNTVRTLLDIDNNGSLTNLNGLENLDSVGVLFITSNAVLNDLNGLDGLNQTDIVSLIIDDNSSLTTINTLNNFVYSGFLNIGGNSALQAISGLNNLQTLGGLLQIIENPSLTDLSGLNGLTTINQNLQILDNDALTTINGFGNLTTVTDIFVIAGNEQLQNIDGFGSLSSLNSVGVVGNQSLEQIDGLSTLTSITGNLNIRDNPVLSDCCGVFPLLDNGGIAGSIFIQNNPMPCSNEQDILDDPNCSSSDPLPDLIPQGVVAPLTSVQAGGGAGFGVSFTAVNTGGPLLPGQEPFRAKLYLSTDNQLSNNDIQIGGNLILGLGTASLGGSVPLSTPPGQYFALLFLDADEEVPENDETNNVQAASQLITVTPNTGGGDIDLSLSLFQNNAAPAQWSNYTIIASITNEGSSTATGVKVHFPKPDGVVYTGGNEWIATQGSFNPFGNEEWNLGSIPAGETASLTVSYFLLATDSPAAYAQVIAANETDGDSTPGNGTPPAVNEDDEASTGGGGPPFLQPDLVLIDLDIENSPVEAGQVLNYNFDASNMGAGPAADNFTVKAYISTDNLLSNDDIQDGIIPTGNFGAGLTLPNIPGASSIPGNLPAGDYFLILKIDADDEVAESNEFNNIISAPFLINNGGTGGPSCSFTTFYDPTSLDPLDLRRELTLSEDANGYTVSENNEYDNLFFPPATNDSYQIDLAGNVIAESQSPNVLDEEVLVETDADNNVTMVFVQSPDLPAGTEVPIDIDYSNPTDVITGGRAVKTANGYAFGIGIVDTSMTPLIINRVIQTDNFGQNVVISELTDSDFFGGFGRLVEGPDGSIFTEWTTSGNFSLFAVPADGSAPWQVRVATDTPSSDWEETEVSQDGNFVYTMKTDNLQAFVARYSVSDGTLNGIDLVDLKTSSSPTGFRQTFGRGIEPTADGGLLVSIGAREVLGNLPDLEILAKYDAAGNLVWKQEIPDADFVLTPVGETSDGGALFAGFTGPIGSPPDQTVFLKTAAGGTLTPECDNTGSGVDLELSMSASNTNPTIYSNTEVTVTVNNTGNETATGVAIHFPKPDGTVYTGGSEWAASQGSFNAFGNEEWTVGEVPAGGTASITVSYFLLTADALTPFAQVSALNETDTDSSPGNGTCCTPLEDDEAAILINGFNSGNGIALKTPDRFRLLIDKIYPNPAKYFITMEIFAPNAGEGILEIYDQTGRQVFFEKGNNIFQLPVSQLRSGFYNVIGRSDGHPAYGRFVKTWED